MKLYCCSTNAACFEFLFTADTQRATELFGIYMMLAKVVPTKFWFTELTPDTVIPGHRGHLREALSRGVEAFASYEDSKGWVMRRVEDVFDELSAEAGEGGVR